MFRVNRIFRINKAIYAGTRRLSEKAWLQQIRVYITRKVFTYKTCWLLWIIYYILHTYIEKKTRIFDFKGNLKKLYACYIQSNLELINHSPWQTIIQCKILFFFYIAILNNYVGYVEITVDSFVINSCISSILSKNCIYCWIFINILNHWSYWVNSLLNHVYNN